MGLPPQRPDGNPTTAPPARPRFRRSVHAAHDVVVELVLDDGALITLHLSGVQSVSTRFEATWHQSLAVGLAARDEPHGEFQTVARLTVPDLISHLLENLPGVELTRPPRGP